jgi:Dolichyl-phosphate-mannose-protein mannosyltransferase
VLAVALGLRLWGIAQGLPYVYNLDESDHFVPHAVAMFSGGLNPHYFANPPALTYLLHLLLAVWFGGRAGVAHAFAVHPGDVYVLARATSAALGTAAVWLLYLVGSRLFNRGVGLLAAAIEAVAFLPVFYAHLALNDVPTLAPLTLSLLGVAGVVRRGRGIDYAIAGVGLGIACATKYTAGIVAVPLIMAIAARLLARPGDPAQGGGAPAASPSPPGASPSPPGASPALLGAAIAGAAALGSFLIANPYALLDFQLFHRELAHQSTLSGEAQGKLGAPHGGGLVYYLWSLTWGLGWAPALAALGGAVMVWRAERRLGWLLVPAPVLLLLFMGSQGRYFGRWLLPVFPILCLLAAYFALSLAATLAGRLPRLRAAAMAVAVLALCGQGAVYSIHSGLVLSRADTRNLARAWIVAHVPPGTRVVVEPVVPNAWVSDIPGAAHGLGVEARWEKYPSLLSVLDPASGTLLAQAHRVRPEDYERTLGPALLAYYAQHGYCWILSGSTQSGRAYADPKAVPEAIAYYRALAAQSRLAYHLSPYAAGQAPVPFGFDWSFDYYPLAYERPGPEVSVYRLDVGSCASAGVGAGRG